MQSLNMPIFSYQVSGEYAMLKTAVMQSMLDEKDAVLESLIASSGQVQAG